MNSNNFREYQKIASDMRKMLSTKTFSSNEEMYLEMIELENIWRELLLSTKHGFEIYEKFVSYIVNEKKNILDARPYFRLRQQSFLKKVNPYIRKNKPIQLTKHRINYTFIVWANNLYDGPHFKALKDLEVRIAKIRSDFVMRNFPLILNRMKIILHTYPALDNVPDLMNVASASALNAVDKYVPVVNKRTGEEKYSSVMLSSIIARIHAGVLNYFSNQQIHYYPQDKKKLMHINRLKRENLSDQEICAKLEITEGEMSRLFSGFFTTPIEDMSYSMKDENCITPDNELINMESNDRVKEVFGQLSFLEQKILKLKGFGLT